MHMTPSVILNTSNASAIVKSVSSGMGIGFIPVSNMVLDPNIVYFLLDPPLYRIHCMVYRKKMEKDLPFQRLFEMAQEYTEQWSDLNPEVGDLIPGTQG